MVDSNKTSEQDIIELRVMETAKELFVHFGYDKTTMNDIARQAGIAKSTIYLRWKKKEELFDTLLWTESRAYVQEWFAAVEDDPNGGTYGTWMRHALGLYFKNPFLKALYQRDRRILGSMLHKHGVERLYVQRMQLFRQFFQRMQKAGAVRADIDEAALTYLLNALQYGLIQFSDVIPNEHAPPMERVLSMMVDMIEATVTPDGGGDSEAGKVVLREFQQQILDALDHFEQQQQT